MNTTTRTLIAIPLAAAALSVGAAPVMAETVNFPFAGLDDKDGPNPDPDPQDGPDDKDGPNNDPGPQGGPDDLDGPNPGDNDDDDDDGDNDDGDNDDSDDDDGDNDDNDGDDDGDNKVRRPSRVDAGAVTDASDGSLSVAWALASGAMVTAAGGFTARRAAQKRG